MKSIFWNATLFLVVPSNQFQTAQPQQQQQQQQIVILSTPDGNSPQGQVIQQIQTDNGQQVSPTQSVGGKKQVKSKYQALLKSSKVSNSRAYQNV